MSLETPQPIEDGDEVMEFPTMCLQCAKPFEGKRADTKYCSSTCRSRANREANGDGSSSENATMVAGERNEHMVIQSGAKSAGESGGIEYETRIAMLEMRLTSLATTTERLDRLEALSATVDRTQVRLTGMESSLSGLADLAGRFQRVESEQMKLVRQASTDSASPIATRLSSRLDSLETKLAPLAALPERLRTIEKRGTDSGDPGARVEALEARGQLIQRVQKSVAELQAKVEVGLEETRNRKPVDTGATQRLLEARVAPLEQRVERLAAQARNASSPDDSRIIRIEQRVERLNGQFQAASTDDSSASLLKIERHLVAVRTRLEGLENDPDTNSSTVVALGERVESLSEDLTTLRSQAIGLSHAIEALQEAAGFVSEDEDEEPDWDDED